MDTSRVDGVKVSPTGRRDVIFNGVQLLKLNRRRRCQYNNQQATVESQRQKISRLCRACRAKQTSCILEPPKLSLNPASFGANFSVRAAMTSRGLSN